MRKQFTIENKKTNEVIYESKKLGCVMNYIFNNDMTIIDYDIRNWGIKIS